MIAILGLVCGALWGAWLARRRRGNILDMAQYAASFGIALGLLGLVVSVAVLRMT